MASIYLHSQPLGGGRAPGRLSPVRIRTNALCRHPIREDIKTADAAADAKIPEQRTPPPTP